MFDKYQYSPFTIFSNSSFCVGALNGQHPFSIVYKRIPNDHLSDKWGLCGTFDTTYGAMYVGVPQYEFIYFYLLP